MAERKTLTGLIRLAGLPLPLAAAMLFTGAALAQAPELPESVPVPELNRSQSAQKAAPADVPVPEPRPADAPKPDQPATDTLNQQTSDQPRPEPPAIAPTPSEKPAEAEPPAAAMKPPEKPAQAPEKEIPPDPRSVSVPQEKMPEEELACRRRLKSMGVDFEERKAEHDAAVGCSIPYPIALKTLGKSLDITPETELNCQMAEAAARFAANIIQPAAKAELGASLKSVGQASAFVCRPRHGTGKLSEHAFGNALDIASFTLSDGRKIDVGPAPPEKDAKFLNTVRKAACGPFKTVLGPGSDADHSLHLHLDLAPRRNGGTFCQ
ncbi:MAG: extensin family protein [Mesorhizobium sp.]|uniref:extensin-like domain-containing protein n=2 Tax=Mesorhizobium sp. TaxID=1871066 RepID=UPI001200FB5E|nr:extensin family protein [Mesorhizobium sp.]TIP76007.1 MAG: extensin family protein [Mesorhizobium sp.]TIQ13548.1 MAG: extensin family protein [Mesorhizobium sp.]TIR53481.1 MAG: extensin family protein [Mesorhizobium sp.]TJV97877.1 MAG: extensin family protein [Mesorhizobium sp.]